MGNNQHKQIGEIFTEDWMKEIQHRTPEIKEPLATDKQFETDSKRFIRVRSKSLLHNNNIRLSAMKELKYLLLLLQTMVK